MKRAALYARTSLGTERGQNAEDDQVLLAVRLVAVTVCGRTMRGRTMPVVVTLGLGGVSTGFTLGRLVLILRAALCLRRRRLGSGRLLGRAIRLPSAISRVVRLLLLSLSRVVLHGRPRE